MEGCAGEPLAAGTAWAHLTGAPGTVVLSGAIDATAAGALRRLLETVLGTLPAGTAIVVDIGAVTCIDAGGVQVLLDAKETAPDRLSVVGAVPAVRRSIEACGAWERLAGATTGYRERAERDRLRARAELRRSSDAHLRIRAEQEQRLVDTEVRATRRCLLTRLRTRLRVDPLAAARSEFLVAADRATVLDAILLTAIIVGRADAVSLQLYDSGQGVLYIVRQRGFSAAFLKHFAAVDRGPSVCGTAVSSGELLLVDDIAASSIFTEQTREVVLAAGFRAVQSYPLLDDNGELIGVVSLHHKEQRPRDERTDLVALAAAAALRGMGVP